MHIKFDNIGPKLTKEKIEIHNKSMIIPIPTCFVDLLLQYNGGMPSPYVVDIPGYQQSPTDVQVIFGIGREIESSNFDWNISVYADLIENSSILPFARDSGGNLFCIHIHNSNIVYYDEESCAIYQVASNLNKFLNSLHDS